MIMLYPARNYCNNDPRSQGHRMPCVSYDLGVLCQSQFHMSYNIGVSQHQAPNGGSTTWEHFHDALIHVHLLTCDITENTILFISKDESLLFLWKDLERHVRPGGRGQRGGVQREKYPVSQTEWKGGTGSILFHKVCMKDCKNYKMQI